MDDKQRRETVKRIAGVAYEAGRVNGQLFHNVRGGPSWEHAGDAVRDAMMAGVEDRLAGSEQGSPLFRAVVDALAEQHGLTAPAAKPKPKPRPKGRQKASDPIEPTEDGVNDDG